MNTNIIQTILENKNFYFLIIGYALYILHLILFMKDEGITYKSILYEIVIFFALLACKEYQNITENSDEPGDYPSSPIHPEEVSHEPVSSAEPVA